MRLACRVVCVLSVVMSAVAAGCLRVPDHIREEFRPSGAGHYSGGSARPDGGRG